MKKVFFSLFLIVFALSSFSCKEKKEKSIPPLVSLALTGSGAQSPQPVTDTYKDGSSFTLAVGGSVTLNPPNHVAGSTYTVSPTLPPGLSLDPNTGVISGSPTTPVATTTYTVTQTKPDGTQVSYTFTITVNGDTGGGGGGGTPEQVATPTFSPSAGVITSLTNITISTSTSGATIYYTTDGSTPSSPQYTSALVNVWSLAGKTIKAFAVKSGMLDSSVLSGIFSYPPLKTGQTTVYQTGDNGTHQSGVARGYTDNGDSTITDNATGLVWQKCSIGQNNDATCSRTATTSNWSTAIIYSSGLSLASRTWRLPTVNELKTLVDTIKSSPGPTIDTTYFPGTVKNPSDYYWSSTTFAPTTTKARVVRFFDGGVDGSVKTNSYYVRCVSEP